MTKAELIGRLMRFPDHTPIHVCVAYIGNDGGELSPLMPLNNGIFEGADKTVYLIADGIDEAYRQEEMS